MFRSGCYVIIITCYFDLGVWEECFFLCVCKISWPLYSDIKLQTGDVSIIKQAEGEMPLCPNLSFSTMYITGELPGQFRTKFHPSRHLASSIIEQQIYWLTKLLPRPNLQHHTPPPPLHPQSPDHHTHKLQDGNPLPRTRLSLGRDREDWLSNSRHPLPEAVHIAWA